MPECKQPKGKLVMQINRAIVWRIGVPVLLVGVLAAFFVL